MLFTDIQHIKRYLISVFYQLRNLLPRHVFRRHLMQLALMDAIDAQAICWFCSPGASDPNIQGINFNNHQSLLKRPGRLAQTVSAQAQA